MPLLTEFKSAIEWYFYKYYTPKGVKNPGINPYKISAGGGKGVEKAPTFSLPTPFLVQSVNN